MKNLILLLGIATIAVGQAARAQDILPSYTQAQSVSAATTSYDYRYTKHTISSGGKGGHTSTYYSWDPYLDQTTTTARPLTLGRAQAVTTQGTFYGPAYAVGASGTASLTDTPAQAVLTVKFTGATTLTTALGAHKRVAVTALPGGAFTFTLAQTADVTVSTVGSPGGVFRLFGPGTGVLLGPLYGTSGKVTLDTPLSPGTYWVTDGLTYTAALDTQQGTSLNPGKTSAAWGFTMTVTPTGADGGGGSD